MANLGAFLTYAFVVSFTPGPNNILSMLNGSKSGYKKTLNFIMGITCGFFIIMLLSSFFNRVLMEYLPMVKPVISLIGAAFLMYLALKTVGFKFGKQKNKEEKNDNQIVNTFSVGFTMQFLNPKAILYGLTIISTFITPYFSSAIELILWSLFLALIAFLSTSSWALFGTLFNKFIEDHKVGFNYTMSALLVYTAFVVAGIL